MNDEQTELSRLRARYRTPEGMAAELIRVDAIANVLLASVNRVPDWKATPSEKLNLYVDQKTQDLRGENLDLGDAMEVIGAVASLIKMFK